MDESEFIETRVPIGRVDREKFAVWDVAMVGSTVLIVVDISVVVEISAPISLVVLIVVTVAVVVIVSPLLAK